MKYAGVILLLATIAVAARLQIAGAPLVEIHRVEHISGAGRMLDHSVYFSGTRTVSRRYSCRGWRRFPEISSAIKAASFWR